ncbi:MAG: PepSY-associated TM helix domain-containing protein [Armatimonadota bacterium]
MAERERRRFLWRPLVRALHRDLGYLAVGLTFVYALSGLAVNHISDWDPNFTNFRETRQLRAPLPEDAGEAAGAVLRELGLRGPVREVLRRSPEQFDLVLDQRTLHVDRATGQVVDEGQRPRFFLRAANWLHLNRGKKAWTVVADLYAVGLLLLATSGLFMLPGRKGLLGRGGILTALGAAIPILYVLLSGGP